MAEKGTSDTPFHQKGTIRAPNDRPLVGTGSLRAVHWWAQHGGLVGEMPTTLHLKICPGSDKINIQSYSLTKIGI